MAGGAVYTVGISAMCFNDSDYAVAAGDPATRGMIIAGAFSAVNEFNFPDNLGAGSASGLARLTREGFIDARFNSGTGFNNGSTIYGLCDIDGSNFIVTGNFTSYNGTDTHGVVILNNTGVIVKAFATGLGPRAPTGGGPIDSYCFKAVKRGDGKFYICGLFDHFGGDAAGNHYEQVVCIDSSGAIDSSFDTSGFPTLYSGTDIQVYNDMTVERVSGALTNRVLCVGVAATLNGLFTDSGIGLALYNANGTPDSDFGDDTLIPHNAGASVPNMKCCATQRDGKYLIGGEWSTGWLGDAAKRHIIRLAVTGELDGTFNANAGDTSNDYISCVAVQEGLGGGRIVIGGLFFGVWGLAGLQRSCIARLSPNGEVEGLTLSGVTVGEI